MRLKNVCGIFLPEHEKHLLSYATSEGWTYQHNKLERCLSHLKSTRTAIDIGGHVGLWSKTLTKLFDKVVAFEPVDLHREAFVKNVSGNYELHPFALGDEEKRVRIHTTKGSSGDSWVEGEGDIEMRRLDDFCIEDVDFIKADCEGYELPALRGGVETIKKYRPVIIVEQKPGRAQKFGFREKQAVEFLQSLGYELKDTISGDYILA